MSKYFTAISAKKATAIISITCFLSYVVGFLRDKIIAYYFGTGFQTDIYNASFVIPDAIFNMIIASALTAAFMPVFSDYLGKNKEEGFKIANTMLTISTLFVIIISTVLFIFMDKVIPIIFSRENVDPIMLRNITTMTRMLLPLPLLFAISNTFGNILMSYKHFFSYAISPILYNIGIISGIIFLSSRYGIYSAAQGAIIGAFFHCIIRVFDIYKTDYKPKLSIQVRLEGFRKIIKLMLPRSMSLIASSINTIIFASVGTSLLVGGYAAFIFAKNIQGFAVSLFGVSFATAIFPYLTGSISQNNKEAFTIDIQKTIQRILFFTVPSMIGIMVLSKDIIFLILGGGQFDEKSIALTSGILFFFSLSIPFESLTQILSRAFFALKNTLTPMIIHIVAISVNIFITLKIATKYGINWFSIGFTISFMIQVFLLSLFLSSHLQNFNYKKFAIYLIKLILAVSFMGITILTLNKITIIPQAHLEVLAKIMIGGLSFIAIAFALKIEEVKNINIILARLARK